MTTLQEQIKLVAEMRQDAKASRAHLDGLRAEWEAEHQALRELVVADAERCAEAEVELRDLTIADYRATGNKAPAPGVGIRVGSKLLYDAGQAFSWAKQHGLALKLDVPAFEKIAKASPPDFVAAEPQITATIASDLDAVLQEVKP